MKKTTFLFLLVFFMMNIYSQKPATIKESMTTLKTYPFNDPNPIPNPNNFYYPYHRFDGFAIEGRDQLWKEVILENDYIKVSIFPDIGGKIWGAIEKSTGNEFIYYNSVVKFRDIAMRGPWTSGGLELNFGIIGHSPSTSTPIDYVIKTNKNGSVSCFLSGTDLFTRTRWETEVNLEHNKAYFTTKTTWHNPTPLNQPYYHWINGGFHAKGNLEFFFPGSHWIGHDGQAHKWPSDDKGNDLSFYSQNNFGGDKSYHIVGGLNDFFAAYWHDTDFGSGHFAPYGEKLGRKIFMWSQARSGAIWEDLLTDDDGQYVEFQSGRLFNQAVHSSTQTPFKHIGFEPYATEMFTEYWFPIKSTKGVRKANQTGILNFERKGDKLFIYFCPLVKIVKNLSIYFGNKLAHEFSLNLDVLENWKVEIENNSIDNPLSIVVGSNELIYSEKGENELLNRPMKSPSDFDWNSVYGLFTDGLHRMHQNDFINAKLSFEKCLIKDPNYLPALNQMAILYYRKADFDKAIQYSSKSLSINTYDPEANFIFGLANKKMDNFLNAQDGFAVASLNPSYRNASNIELSKLFLLQNNLIKSKFYASKVLEAYSKNIEANKIMAVIYRLEGNLANANNCLQVIDEMVQLNHQTNLERWLLNNTADSKTIFKNQIKNELPHETYLELAYWYKGIGDISTALKILNDAPKHSMIYLNLAYLYNQSGNTDISNQYLNKVFNMSTDFVFPFRLEEKEVLEWAVKTSDNWKLRYYLGLLHWSLGNRILAKEHFLKVSHKPESPYFYIAKSLLFDDEDSYTPEKDLIRAQSLGFEDWRTSEKLIDYYLQSGQSGKALKIAKQALSKFDSNNTLKYVYAKCLMSEGQYSNARNSLMRTTILPSEGARYGRVTYRQACIMEAVELYEKKQFKSAIKLIGKSRLWPENLGAGKPYTVDERIEDFLEAKCWLKMEERGKSEELYKNIIEFTEGKASSFSSVDYLYLIILQNNGLHEQIQKYLDKWEQNQPIDNTFKWCQAMLKNNYDQALKIEGQINTETGGTPWDPKYADTDFEIIKTIARAFKN